MQICQMEVSNLQESETQNNSETEEEGDDGVDESVRKAFNDFDQDGDGTISIAELRHVLGPGGALCEFGGNLNNDEIDALVSVADKDGDGEVSFEEFVELVSRMKGPDTEEDMQKAFKFFDIDEDGAISREDLKEGMLRLGHKLSDEELAEIFADADDDGDGMVDYDEFVQNITAKG